MGQFPYSRRLARESISATLNAGPVASAGPLSGNATYREPGFGTAWLRSVKKWIILWLMLKILAILFLPVGISSAQTCTKYGVSTMIEGTLSLRDEAGYNQFIVLKPLHPICAEVDPGTVNDSRDEYYRQQDGVREVQAGVYGSDAPAEALRNRLEILTGHRVIIKGDLFPARTGYHRTNLQLRVEQVEAADTAGQQALQRPKVPFIPRNVAAYDVAV